jgi:hypothetical protein
MGESSKPQSYPKGNTAGKRAGMFTGNAPAPGKPGGQSRGHVHDAGYTYADYAKSNPRVGGTGKKK